jgi:hypothetical protein
MRRLLVVCLLLAGLLTLAVGSASAGTSAATCSGVPGTFTITICGNKWVNGSGQEVVLRGANTEGTQYDCAQSGAGFFNDPTVSGTDFSTEIAAMKAWGINIVRVNLNEECWLGINGVPSTTSAVGSNGYNAYANEMGAYVTALNNAGIYAEVDLHLNAPGSELISDSGNDDFQNPMPESNSVTFWASVASYFASNHAVIFGVFNEPFPVNYNSDGDTAAGWGCDLNGCTVNDCTDSTGNCSGTYAGVGMKALIDTIREYDTTTPLLVGGPDFAGDMDDWLATFYPGGVSIDPDNLLAASVHIYFPSGNSPCSVTTNVSSSCPSTGADAITQVAARTPVLVDELSDFSCSGNESTTSSLTPFLQTMDYVDLVTGDDIGWVGWAWTTSGCDPNMITSWTTGAPSPMGTVEYCELNFDGVNNGSLTNCKISDVGNPPTTSVLIPSNGATLSGSTTLDASASNANSVQFWLFGGSYGFSGHSVGTATLTEYGWLYNWNSSTVPNGSYALLSEATGAGGSLYSSGVNITVSNPPTTSVLIPSNGATLSGSTTLDASASNAESSGGETRTLNLAVNSRLLCH